MTAHKPTMQQAGRLVRNRTPHSHSVIHAPTKVYTCRAQPKHTMLSHVGASAETSAEASYGNTSPQDVSCYTGHPAAWLLAATGGQLATALNGSMCNQQASTQAAFCSAGLPHMKVDDSRTPQGSARWQDQYVHALVTSHKHTKHIRAERWGGCLLRAEGVLSLSCLLDSPSPSTPQPYKPHCRAVQRCGSAALKHPQPFKPQNLRRIQYQSTPVQQQCSAPAPF